MGAKMLRQKGFKHVWAYEGGTAEWKHKGFTVKGPGTEAYLQDHEMPEEALKRMAKDSDVVITAEELHKKMLKSE
jgi:hypothetical protein